MITIRIEADEPRELDAWAKRWLTKRGYKVGEQGEWESTCMFCARIGISVHAFIKIRNRSGCPTFETREGPTGRLIDLKPTTELERFCRLHKPIGRTR